MHVLRYGLKWAQKPSGHWQSTTVGADGKRLWLHRYTWEQERGAIPPGCEIHHVDRDRSNNDISNLQCLTREAHDAEHRNERSARGSSDAQREVLKRAGALSAASRNGEYVGYKKRREAVDRLRTCPTCGTEFKLGEKDNDATTYCSTHCQQKARRKYAEWEYKRAVSCKQCGGAFVPGRHGIGHSEFCSESCRDKHRYANKHISRKCQGCGETMRLSAGGASRYCGDCKAAGKDMRKAECAACGSEVLSRNKNGRVFCNRKCSNLMRRFERDSALHERFKQAVREGRLHPGDRVPRDL